MKQTVLILLLAASTMAASAQTPAKPAAPAAKPATTAAKSATTSAKPAATSAASSSAIKLPPGVKPVAGTLKTIFTVSLRYQDIEIGTGADAVPNKLYKILYTGYRASDGAIFDSTDKHPRAPVLGQDGKPMLDPDGKPIQGPAQPISLPVGVGNAIIGFDQGFDGMKVGGKRRIFIPWQLAYGVRAMPDRGPDSPGIPPKSDLIFDVQLVDMTEIPAPPARPGAGMAPGMHPMPGGHPAAGTPPAPGTPAAPPAPGTAPKPAAPPTPTAAPAPTSAPAPAPTPTPAPTQQK